MIKLHSKFESYLPTAYTVPIASVELILGIPPIAGITTGVVGTGATYKSEQIKNLNNWLQLLR